MRMRVLVLVAAVQAAGPHDELFGQTATQVVRFQVNAINQIGVTGNPAPMVINTATAGSAPMSVVGSGTSYAITTNETNKKITASLNQSLPAGIVLQVLLAAPTGAASLGEVSLTASGTDVVTGISTTSASSLAITYRLSAVATVQMAAPSVRTVTFTIVSGT
jgi:hypothetical protein